jgi:hypothetical protein
MVIINSPPVVNAIVLILVYILAIGPGSVSLILDFLEKKYTAKLDYYKNFVIVNGVILTLALIGLIISLTLYEMNIFELEDPEMFEKATVGFTMGYSSLSIIICLIYSIMCKREIGTGFVAFLNAGVILSAVLSHKGIFDSLV